MTSSLAGEPLRRRVRWITAVVAGTAAAASLGVTAALAAEHRGTTSQLVSTSGSTAPPDDAAVSGDATDGGITESAEPDQESDEYSGGLAAPRQAPLSGSGGGHVRSGGS